MDERSNDYLAHYGVLGMKWGVRKAKKSGKKYNYESMETKQYKKIANRTSNPKRKKKYKTIANNSAKLDSKRVAYAKKTSVGKAIAQNLLFGPINSKTYQTLRSVDYSRGKAAAISVFTYAGAARVGLIIAKGETLNGKKKNKKL